jgi:hypothetical protein
MSAMDRGSKEQDDSRAWEKWSHWVLLQHYHDKGITAEKDPLLHLYLLKAQKLEARYSLGYSSSVLESMYEQQLLEELASEQELKEQNLIQPLETTKPILKRLSFPFDQVSEGIFLGYLMEVLCKQSKDTFVSTLKKDIAYEITMVTNINKLLGILRDEFEVEIDDLDITADRLMSDLSAVNELFSLLFDTFVLNSDELSWDGEYGEVRYSLYSCIFFLMKIIACTFKLV